MQSLFFFLVALSILVVIHEYGHYWVARRCGVKVLKFSVGFGRAIWSRTGKNGTKFVIAVLPLGGYVKMLDSREAPVPESQRAYSFNHKPLHQRVAVVAAGPIANLLFAVFAYWLILVMGIPGIKPVIDTVRDESPAAQAQLQAGDQILAVNGEPTATWQSVFQHWLLHARQGETVTVTVLSGGTEVSRLLSLPATKMEQAGSLLQTIGISVHQPTLPPVIDDVVASGSAERAGLQAGDKLLTADDEALSTWQQWVERIQASADKPITVTLLRNSQTIETTLTPENNQGTGRIGVSVATGNVSLPDSMQAQQRFGPMAAVPQAFKQTWTFTTTTITSIWGMLRGNVSTENLGGPISIAQFAGSSAQQGLIAFIGFLAMISISLGILNLLPVPLLDGGHLLMYFIEWIKGSPVSEKVQVQGQKIGLLLLLMLMFFAFANDLTRLFG